MRKIFFISLLVLAMTLGVCISGCSKKEGESGKTKIAFITNNTANFWVFARRGCEKAATELPGFEVDFRITSDATPAEQRRIIDDLLARGVKGIAISPVDPINQKPFIDELAGKIAVITCDSDIPGSKRKCYIGTDNVAAGRQAGEDKAGEDKDKASCQGKAGMDKNDKRDKASCSGKDGCGGKDKKK